jgi:hypothetical protein
LKLLDRMQDRLDRMPGIMPGAMGVRRQTVEHPFGTLKAWKGAAHFLTRTLDGRELETLLHHVHADEEARGDVFLAEPDVAQGLEAGIHFINGFHIGPVDPGLRRDDDKILLVEGRKCGRSGLSSDA